MSVTMPTPHHELLFPQPLSRKFSVNIDQPEVNVRPIVKGAIKEAAHTLAEAYHANEFLRWCARGLQQPKHSEFLYTFFKHIINASTLASRDFAVQVDGCKGVLIWSHRTMIASPSLSGTFKIARLIGWSSALKTSLKFQPASCDKMRRKIMAEHGNNCLVICYLGVLPHEQGKGLGRALLQPVLDKADAAHYQVYAEVSDEKAVGFFERFGFYERGRVLVDNKLHIIFMVRDPVIRSDPVSLQFSPGRRVSA